MMITTDSAIAGQRLKTRGTLFLGAETKVARPAIFIVLGFATTTTAEKADWSRLEVGYAAENVRAGYSVVKNNDHQV